MIHYGISMVHIDPSSGEIVEAKVHGFFRDEKNSSLFAIDVGKPMRHEEIARLIVAGNKVWVLQMDAQGGYKHAHRVRKQRGGGQHNYIESYDKKGERTTALIDLPKY